MTATTEVAEVTFLRDLAARIFKHATPIQGFDQGDSDQLYALAHRIEATAELVAALEKIQTIAAPGQEMALSDAIDALCDCLNLARTALANHGSR